MERGTWKDSNHVNLQYLEFPRKQNVSVKLERKFVTDKPLIETKERED